ncbi:hypothetical protein PUR28_18860 [Streptomyces sp. BE308]|uniref:hypothetical protein n=1 Tax=Streptomyces sp. BE308 TaxID=3002529 RepID=UPI002E75D6F1|nr:hypothetical protein [Streptomyces sp. BE308]MEE1792795.1 hypothetical protein [Streptomyces sp. BE308]
MSELMGAADGAGTGEDDSAEDGAENGAERPELGRHRRTYRPQHRRLSAYALLLLALAPFSALTYFLTILLGAFLGREGSVAAAVAQALGGERIRGLRTRTANRGAQLPKEEEWGPAILQGVRDAQLGPAAEAVLGGGEVPFGESVLSQDGLTVRRRRGRDDSTAWEDVGSLSLTVEGSLLVSSRGSDFPTHFAWPGYRIPNLEIFLDMACQLLENRPQTALTPAGPTPEAPTPAGTTPEAPTPARSRSARLCVSSSTLGGWPGGRRRYSRCASVMPPTSACWLATNPACDA